MDPSQARLLELTAEARAQSRSLRHLPSVAARCVRLVYRAGGRALWANVAVQLCLALLGVLQVVAAEWALQSLVDLDDGSISAREAIPPFLFLVVPFLGSALLGILNKQLQRLLGERVEQATWDRVLDVSTSVDLTTYESPEFYDQLRRVEANTLLRPFTVSMGLVNLVGGIVGAVVLSVALLRIQPWIVPLLVIGCGPLLLVARRLGNLEFRFAVEMTPLLRERRYLREVLIGRTEAKEVRSLGAVAALRARYQRLCRDYVAALGRQARRAIVWGLVGGGASSAVTLVSLGLVFAFVAAGQTSLAQAGAILIAVRLLSAKMQQLSSAIGTLFESSLFLDDLEQFEARRPRPVPAAPALPAPEPITELRLEDVGFVYPGADTAAVVGLDLTIRTGEVVALVGENGSGKTTLSKVIAQLYQPTTGRVHWNGADASTLDPAARRQQISVTFQDFVRFALSASQNIGLGGGDLDPSRPLVGDAALRAGADEFIRRLPAGYDTLLGKEFAGGTDLSVGQWQRVALARAFFRDARLIILDEPTASLDPRAERAVFDTVRELCLDRAVLLITHRLATVRHADRIYVLDEGRVVEQGSHATLLDAGGAYAELFTLQASGFVDSF